MIGAIIGDIVGSIYEFDNIKTKEFQFFQPEMSFTDDSILTFATAQWLLEGGDVAECYLRYAQAYPHPMGSYGSGFVQWVYRSGKGVAEPYNSCGNGSAMRVGPVGWAFATKEETLAAAKTSAECTHNHHEGIKGAQATALCIFMARHGATKEEIAQAMTEEFGYDLTMSVEELQRRYSWRGIDGKGNGGICQDSVPQAIICALKATSFEDAVRNAISIGGDSDTIGCITGAIAEAIYGVPAELRTQAEQYLDAPLRTLLHRFEEKWGAR
ncbi:MAG: ADP-ribosylglycohydrolase family protein [Bacteroidales bacterium]|nr:ADP-ribosylglycohydrolase family protein [Bacteroidales bacterium]